MAERSTKRPDGFTKPAHWSSEPPPQPEPLGDTALHGDGDHPVEGEDAENMEAARKVSPTRYGDWTKDGIAIDF